MLLHFDEDIVCIVELFLVVAGREVLTVELFEQHFPMQIGDLVLGIQTACTSYGHILKQLQCWLNEVALQ